jgi:hypothetical protein
MRGRALATLLLCTACLCAAPVRRAAPAGPAQGAPLALLHRLARLLRLRGCAEPGHAPLRVHGLALRTGSEIALHATAWRAWLARAAWEAVRRRLLAAQAAGAGPHDAPAPAPGSAPLLGQPAAAVAAMPVAEVAGVAVVAPDGSVDMLAKPRPALAPAAAQAPAAPDASLASFAVEALVALAAAPAPSVGASSAPLAARDGGAGSARAALTPAPAPASALAQAAARAAPQASFVELADFAARVPVGAPAAAAAAPGAGQPAHALAPAAAQPVRIVATEATAGKQQTPASQTAVAAQPLAIVGDPCAVYDPVRQGALHMNCQIQARPGPGLVPAAPGAGPCYRGAWCLLRVFRLMAGAWLTACDARTLPAARAPRAS